MMRVDANQKVARKMLNANGLPPSRAIRRLAEAMSIVAEFVPHTETDKKWRYRFATRLAKKIGAEARKGLGS